jgi:biopolymer transport protein ExbD
MVGASINPYGSEWGAGFLWHRMDWLVRLDVVVLGLLLLYTVVIVVRVFHRNNISRHNGEIADFAAKNVISELNIQVGTLKSIVSTAPYVGSVGTCFGILNALFGFGGGNFERHTFEAIMASRISAALVPSAAAIVVAVPATCAYEYCRTRLESMVNELPGRERRLLATSRFTGLPPFSAIAASGLTFIVLAFAAFYPWDSPKGFDIDIASARCGDSDLSGRVTLLHITNGGRVFINREEQDWGTLEGRLSEMYRPRAQRILYVLADEEVRFQTVADAFDLVHNAQETPSTLLDIRIRLLTPSRCPEPVLIPVRTYRSQ